MSDETKQVFADGVDNLSLTAGAFRFDLVTIEGSKNQKKNAQPDLNKVARIIMTPQAFSQTLRAFNQLLVEAEKQGLVVRKVDGEKPEEIN